MYADVPHHRYTSFPRLTDPPAQYRVIKRPQSFLADKLRNAAGEPMNKRPKTLTNSGNVQARHRAYAPRSASLRRAASLRSDRVNFESSFPLVPSKCTCRPPRHILVYQLSLRRRKLTRPLRPVTNGKIIAPPSVCLKGFQS